MAKVKIVTDSTADIPAGVREALGIVSVPLKVHFGEETFRDGVDITANTFYPKLQSSSQLPTTSQPSPVDFMEVYKQIIEENGDDTAIISFHISAALSGTYQSAVLAKSLLEQQATIEIVDTRLTCSGLGMMVIAAAKAAQAGQSVEDITAMTEQLRHDLRLYFIVDTLEYLQKGGRIGKASAFIGSLLNIKPILTVDSGGEVAPLDKVRGSKKAVARIIDMLKADFAQQPLDICIAHSEAREGAEQLMELITANFEVSSSSYTEIGPVIGAHVGPGALSVFASPSPSTSSAQ